MAWLEIQSGARDSYRVPLRVGETIRVGRAAANDVILGKDSAVSRFHAEFTFDGTTCTVTDVGSRNHTFVDDVRISRPTVIPRGSWVGVGRTRIRIVDEREPEAETHSPTLTSTPELSTTDSVMLSVSDVVDSIQEVGEPSPRLRAFATLSKATNELLAQRPLAEVLELVIDLVFEIASPDRGAVMLTEGEPARLRPAASRGLKPGEGEFEISRTIVDQVLRQQQVVLTTDARTDDRFGGAHSVILQNIRSAMCVPLWNNRDVIGLIYVDTLGGPKRFDRTDLEALTLVANVAAVKIDNVRLFQQEQRMKEIERELRAAARIQQRLLPAEPLRVPGYELSGLNVPCHDVGGDYFDHVLRDGRTLSVAVGDVSGHGLSAALLMATVQASFHAHLSTAASVAELVSQLNRAVCRGSGDEQFCTFFYGEIDLHSGELRYCNAGHNPPLIVRAAGGEVERLSGGGMILGFDPDTAFTAHRIGLQPGDLIVAYSDGVTESVDPDDEEFGEERLIETVMGCRGLPVEEIRSGIDTAVEGFAGEAEPFDDYTLLLVRRQPSS
jgi:serine phosphatase RsbU (regulator of sigma subunit)